MDVNGKILIQRYDVGYVVTDYTSNKKAAKETAEGVIEVLREALGIPANLFEKMVDQKCGISPSSQMVDVSPAPEHQAAAEPEKPTALQKIKELAQMKDPGGLFIPKFEYDPAQKKDIEGYTNISVVELPDGRAMIQYKGTHYYTTKDKVLQKIPYPTPYSYFSKARLGISSVAQTCLTAYRYYLANLLSADKSLTKNDDETVSTLLQPIGDEQGTCDDITFESCANNSPENCKFCVNESRYENKNNLAAQKPAPPLLRASVPP